MEESQLVDQARSHMFNHNYVECDCPSDVRIFRDLLGSSPFFSMTICSRFEERHYSSLLSYENLNHSNLSLPVILV